ncbi:helix-turn-helix domain-containing protein [Kitasatospora sp. NPDC127059]|uniref:helix-turn-helix domain-containing protein n=1 Tax=unclassified Kitasatospora TaxID=2633591 RepID=UPI003646F43D
MAEHQQEPRATRKPPTAAENFAGQLRTLRLDAGQPSFRTMAKAVGSISHTTLYEAASGSRLPSWPTTRAFVSACGGDEEEWHHRWRAAVKGEPPAEVVIPAPPTAPAPAPAPAPPDATPVPTPAPTPVPTLSGAVRIAPPAAPARPPRTRLWTHALSLLLGLALGVLGTLGLLADRTPAARSPAPAGAQSAMHDCPSADPDLPAPGEHPTPGPPGPGTPPPDWVARTAFGQQAATSTDFTLPVLAPVARGDALVVSVLLTGTCPGPVTVTDSHGDRFQFLGDVTDALRHRVLVLAAFDAAALTTADSIRASYPRSEDFHVAVDEFRGVSTLRAFSPASGDAGGSAFTTAGSSGCEPGDLLVGAVGSNGGTAPEFAAGWTALPVLQLSHDRLTTAHRIATGTDADATHCTATGRTTAQWDAVLVVLR